MGLNTAGNTDYNIGSGLLLVYPCRINIGALTLEAAELNNLEIFCANVNEKTNVTYDDITVFKLSDLTSSAITAMTLSKIPPLQGQGNVAVTEFPILKYTKDGSADKIFWSNSYVNPTTLNKANYFYSGAPTPTDGLPPYINYFSIMWGASPLQNVIEDIPLSLSKLTFDGYSVEQFMQNNPKMISTIYNPTFINDEVIPAPYRGDIGGLQNETRVEGYSMSDIYVGYTLDLKYLVIKIPSGTYRVGVARYKYIPNNAIFAPEQTIDYWTRLNAEQTGLQAQKSRFNAIVGAVFAPITGAIGGGVAGTATMGKNQSAANFGLQAAGAAVGAVAGAVSGIGNAVYAVQSANNLQETADRQYNCGETNAFNASGSYISMHNETEAFIKRVSCEIQFPVIAPNLHRQGYNTFLQIDEIYTNHVRKYFNYFKGADVNVSGLPQNWCDDIANMFNSGVTLWQSDVENYNRKNIQANIGW